IRTTWWHGWQASGTDLEGIVPRLPSGTAHGPQANGSDFRSCAGQRPAGNFLRIFWLSGPGTPPTEVFVRYAWSAHRRGSARPRFPAVQTDRNLDDPGA